MAPTPGVAIKRVYEAPAASDGKRLLVDRLWPRGISKEAAQVEDWLKELAPSAPLRKWFGHDPARWAEFRRRYRAELSANAAGVAELRALARAGRVTLVYAAHDTEHNQARVLAELLNEET